MKYSDLIQFDPIVTVIELKSADDNEKAKELVRSYVMSDNMADLVSNKIISQLKLEDVVDNKGVLVVGNYGTGKSHLMSVISAIAANSAYLEEAQNEKFRASAKSIAGKFEVLRIEIGSTEASLRAIITGNIEQDLARRGITYKFPDVGNITNNKDALVAMMAAFAEKYGEKGYLIIVDELLDYLKGRKDNELMQDIGWKTFFEDLKKRGIGQVDYVISDAHTGLVKALQEVFVEAAWQRCQVHFMRNIMEVCPSKVKPQLLEDLRDLWSSKDPELARERFQEILVTYEALAPKSMEVLEAGFDDAIAVLHLPTKYRRRLRSTNSLERLNQEIRRRERVIRIFPSGESAIRLMGALLAQQSETWLSGRKWLDMAEYWKELIPKDESAEVKQAA
jgi:hypothetical protein